MWVCTLGARVHKWLVGGSKTNCGFRFWGQTKLRSKAEQALKESRYRLGETGDALAKQTREAAARADEYVRDNPWTGVGIGAAVGVVLGVLLTRR